jgi:hypothetical protein
MAQEGTSLQKLSPGNEGGGIHEDKSLDKLRGVDVMIKSLYSFEALIDCASALYYHIDFRVQKAHT